MQRLLVVARLKDGAHDTAERLLREGPPFDVEELGLESHGAYLTPGEVVFVFEGPDVEWTVNEIVDRPAMALVFEKWKELTHGNPRLAHERFHWSRAEDKLGVGLGA